MPTGKLRHDEIISEKITVYEKKERETAGYRRGGYQKFADERHFRSPVRHLRLIRKDRELFYLRSCQNAEYRMRRLVHKGTDIIEKADNSIVQIPPVQKITDVAKNGNQDDNNA